MSNELILILSVVVIFGATVLWYKLFGVSGMYCFTVFVTITANIEVLILVNAFGMDMTLGNVLFAASFLATDILSETAGKRAARKAVWLGIATTVMFLLVSQSWLLYTPSASDFVANSIRTIFSNSPRIMLSSVAVYAVCQFADVHLYHAVWKLTGGTEKYMWVRNNVATLISQALNTGLFTVVAFAGVYDWTTIGSIVISSYAIFIVTSLCDTPALYLARRISRGHRDEKHVWYML